MASEGNAVYATLLLSDHCLPGAMVLAHSLRDNGSRAKLVVLYTPDNLRPETVNELRTIYDDLVPVNPTNNGTPANLWLMDRPDLISTFTKIELWRQTQYSRIVYIDCDIVALTAPDELLSLDVDFAAAPDVGWPDCFNSGMMVLRPNMQDYYALKTLADRGVSFDGADQGLLNEHFRDWHRLSFTYNCTPSANYQYIPAYKHFQSTISLIHFIGAQKPWAMARHVDPVDAPYNQLLGRWWAVYDKHYRPVDVAPIQYRPATPVNIPSQQHYIPAVSFEPRSKPWHQERQPYQPEYKPESHPEPQPGPTHVIAPGPVTEHIEHVQEDPQESYTTDHMHAPELSIVPRYVRGEEHVSTYIHPPTHHPQVVHHVEQHWEPEPRSEHHDHVGSASVGEHGAPAQEAQAFEPPQAEWDASREPPPLNTKPEGIGLQKQTYTMSDDTQLFQPPSEYPEAPKDMYYQVPETKPEPKKLAQMFPWESRAPKPTRVFLDDGQSLVSAHGKYSAPPVKDEPSPPTVPQIVQPPEEPTDTWENYSRSNAWDEVPEIQRYIKGIQQARKAKTQVISSTTTTTDPRAESTETEPTQESTKLTDFPSEVERPSLPVTPAPIRRPSVWNRRRSDDSESELPAAEGVPDQEEWNPAARLEDLRRRQSEVLVNSERLLWQLSPSERDR